MTTTQTDTHDMVLVHRVFRRELGLLPQLVRAARTPDAVQRVRTHAQELAEFLHHHHEGEDALVWPRLRERTSVDAALVDRMESQHEAVATLSAQVDAALQSWGGDPERGEALAGLVEHLHEALVEHLDEEERSVLPLVAAHLTQAEWDELGERGFASVPKSRRLVVLGQILEDADEDERTRFLAHVPAPARVAFRLLGRRQHARETTALRVPLQRRP